MLIFSFFQAHPFLRNWEILDLLINYLRYQKNLDKKTLDNCFGTSLFIISVLESLNFHIHPLFCSSKKLFQYEMYSYFELSAFHEASLFKILNLCLYWVLCNTLPCRSLLASTMFRYQVTPKITHPRHWSRRKSSCLFEGEDHKHYLVY